ncbi:MAG TPA: hypothetical protein PLA68_04145 [Panacibacter sp.]|nr:hypothetical protein [Panacibacter sp.]
MFFKNYFISIAHIIDSQFRGYEATTKNPADKGELCELFIKQFLFDAVGDSFKIFRGGSVVNSLGVESKQIDIILTGKKTIKLFGDKGIFPTETVHGCLSITATLTKDKLIDCCNEFKSIPKKGYDFLSPAFAQKKFFEESVQVWKTLLPYKCVFAYKGEIKHEWINDMLELYKEDELYYNALPNLIIVNKVGMIEKAITSNNKKELSFISFKDYENIGIPFSKLLYHLNTFNWEELYLQPELKRYFEKDMEG